MRPIREYMRDKRVAAALAAVALLFVGYRMMKSGDVPPAPSGQVVESPPPPAATMEPAPPPMVREAPPLRAPIPAGWSGPAWKWDRNPFLPPSAERRPGMAGAEVPAGGEAVGEPAAEAGMPKLRGTVVGMGAGSAIFRGLRPDGKDLLVPVGGTIGEWTLSTVEPYRVSLRRGKEIRVLELYRQ